ncbi:transposase [Pseudomonas synxantha]|nr:transposase [Pseudomonas synxantha]
MMRPNTSVEKVYLYPKPVDCRKPIDGLAALVELDIKVAVSDPVLFVLFVFLNRHRNRVKVLYWERNSFCLWLKRLESERFKTSPDITDEAIVLSVQELNWLNEPESEPLSADLAHIEVIHDLPEHDLTCACGCCEHVIGEETSEQLNILPMQIHVIKHVRKVYGCRGCERAPITADKPAQSIEKSMASPSVLACC